MPKTKTPIDAARLTNDFTQALSAWGPLCIDLESFARLGETMLEGSTPLDCALPGPDHIEATVLGDGADARAFVVTNDGQDVPEGQRTAVIPIVGPITPFAVPAIFALFGIRIASLPAVLGQVRAAVEDPDVSRIILLMHSPGGSAFGVAEAAAELRELGKRKKIITMVNYLSASAAYWLASATSEIVATDHALVGSVGARVRHFDLSRMADRDGVTVTDISSPASKTDLSEFKPLSDSARAELTRITDEVYSLFAADVARARGVDMNQFGEQYGRVYPTNAARSLKMIDRVSTLADLFRERPARGNSSTRRARLAINARK
jgi:signal peptide peptidase SppA